MLLPTIPSISDIKTVAIGGVVLLLVSLCVFAGYNMREADPAILCAPHISRAGVLAQQMSDLQKSVATDRARYMEECEKREEAMCLERITEVKKRITDLRCRICKVAP
jgi:hypothetical protein